jgi:hypothetical protein
MARVKKNNEFKLNNEQMSIVRKILYLKVYLKMKQKML